MERQTLKEVSTYSAGIVISPDAFFTEGGGGLIGRGSLASIQSNLGGIGAHGQHGNSQLLCSTHCVRY